MNKKFTTLTLLLLTLLLLAACQQTAKQPTVDNKETISTLFNGDDFADLAIGSFSENVAPAGSPNNYAGMVHILNGASPEITSTGAQNWSQEDPNLLDNAEPGDYFGYALASGDFNKDGEQDLAIGVPKETFNDGTRRGGVHVLYGDNGGLTATNNQLLIHGDTLTVPSDPSINWGGGAGDDLGRVLAVGDFNNDGFDDLAMGAPGFENFDEEYAGAVFVKYGSAQGLDQQSTILQGLNGIPGSPQWLDTFGSALATGDFNEDGIDDLAIGVPGERVSGKSSAGIVLVLSGSDTGLSDAGYQELHQDVANVASTANASEYFGLALTAGDFNHDGIDDLAVGVPGEDIAGKTNSGAVQIFRGSASGLSYSALLNKSSSLANYDSFGTTLTTANFNGDDYDDLAVGIPKADIGSKTDAGIVNVFYGSANLLSMTDSESWNQSTTGVSDAPEKYDAFGYALAGDDYNNDGYDDLAIGVPEEEYNGHRGAGIVHILWGSSSGISFGGDQLITQSDAGESVEKNDRFGWALTSSKPKPPLPDLTISQVSFDLAPTCVLGQPLLDITVDITNIGTASSPDQSSNPNFVSITEPSLSWSLPASLPSLAPDETHTITFTLDYFDDNDPFAFEGYRTFDLQLHNDNGFTESNTNNNSRTAQFQIPISFCGGILN